MAQQRHIITKVFRDSSTQGRDSSTQGQNQILFCRHQRMHASPMFLKQKGKVKMTVTPVMAASTPEGGGGAGCGRLSAGADRSMVGR